MGKARRSQCIEPGGNSKQQLPPVACRASSSLWLAILVLVAAPAVLSARTSPPARARRLVIPQLARALQQQQPLNTSSAAAIEAELLVPQRGGWVNGSYASAPHAYYWRLPQGPAGGQPDARGLLILLHRCGGSAYDFWPQSGGHLVNPLVLELVLAWLL